MSEASRAAGDKDVYLDGGDLVRQGLDAGLVDEFSAPRARGRSFDGAVRDPSFA